MTTLALASTAALAVLWLLIIAWAARLTSNGARHLPPETPLGTRREDGQP